MTEDIDSQFHESVYVWAHRMNIVGLRYRGGQLDGPNSNKLLQNLDSLKEFVDPKFHPYVDCLKLFSEVKKSCFGTILAPDYLQKIRDFEIAYRKLGISVTVKLHIIFFEVPLFIEKKKKALGHFSSQPFESVHHDFKFIWECFKGDEEHPDHGKNLSKSQVNYNSQHI